MAGVLPAGRCVLIVPYPKQSTCTVNIPPPVSSPFSSSATVLEISHTRLLRTALLFVVGLFLSSVLILLPFQGYYLVFRYLKTLSMGFRVDLAQCKLPAKQIIALSRRDETGGWLCCCCFLSKAVFLRLLSSGRKKKTVFCPSISGLFSTWAFSGFPDFLSDSRLTAQTKETTLLCDLVKAAMRTGL